MDTERTLNAEALPEAEAEAEYAPSDDVIVHVAITDMNSATEGILFEIASQSASEGRRVDTVLSASPALDPLARRLENACVVVHRFALGYDPLSDHMRS